MGAEDQVLIILRSTPYPPRPDQAGVSQSVEEAGREPVECRFESYRRHRGVVQWENGRLGSVRAEVRVLSLRLGVIV